MKNFRIFTMALAALAMFSCAKENTTTTPDLGAPGEKAAVTIKFSNPEGKAASRPANTEDAVIADFSVFLFRANGVLDGKFYSSTTPKDNKAKITGTTAATSVYVVANMGDITADISTKKALEAKLVKLTTNVDGTGTATQTTGKVWMSGSNTISFEDGKKETTAGITLTFVGAKLSLTVDYSGVTTADNGVYGKDYKIDGAFVMNAGGVSKLFGKTMIPTTVEFSGAVSNPYFVSGAVSTGHNPEWTNMAGIYGVTTSLNTSFADVAAVANGAHFYVFEQDATVHGNFATILVVEATWISDNSRKIYFPIKFNLGDAGRTITRGNAYDVNIKLKGNFKTPGEGGNGGGGTEDPGEDVLGSSVEITIVPAAWTAVPVEKEFE